MRGRAVAVEEAGLCGHAGPGADREHDRSGAGLVTGPVEQGRAGRCEVGDDDQVGSLEGESLEARERQVGHDVEPAGERRGPMLGRYGVDVEGVRGGQQLVGQQEVGDLGAGMVEEQHGGGPPVVVCRGDALGGGNGRQ